MLNWVGMGADVVRVGDSAQTPRGSDAGASAAAGRDPPDNRETQTARVQTTSTCEAIRPVKTGCGGRTLASHGWTPARSTLLNVLQAAAHLIRPFVAHLREVVRAGPIIGTDDTTVTLVVKDSPLPGDDDNPKNVRAREVIAAAQAESRGSITARMWVYRSITAPINVFDFTVSRHQEGPGIFLEGFVGSLMADCYAGYDSVETKSDGRIIRAACVAHARRKVFDARGNSPVHASMLLSMFRQLYDIEDRAKAFTPEDRLALRQAESRPIWKRIREYLASEAMMSVMPKELFGEALTYLRNQFEHLLVYLDDGLMPIDNNETEQLIK